MSPQEIKGCGALNICSPVGYHSIRWSVEKVDVVVHWLGGHQSPATMIRPVARLEQLSYVDALRGRVAQLHQQGIDRPTIAATLNAEGWRPAKRRQTFTADMVGALLARQGLGVSPSRPRAVARKPDEWTLPELAYTLAMPEPTLYAWLRKGHLKARRDQGSGQWLLWADASELQRL